jgi:hypothetical protein
VAPGELGVEHRRHDHREIRQGELVLAQKIDAERVIVEDDELLGLLQAAGAHLEGRKTADGNSPVERPLHVASGHLGAVVEGSVTAQLEGDRHAFGRNVEILGQLRLDLGVVVG